MLRVFRLCLVSVIVVALSGCETPIKVLKMPIQKIWPDFATTPDARYIATAQAAWQRGDRAEYNGAVSALIEKHSGRLEAIPGMPIEWACAQHYEPGYFDDLVSADTLSLKGLPTRFRQEGWGAALVGVRENRHRTPVEDFYPKEGIFRPLNALVLFDANGAPRLRVSEPIRTPDLQIERKSVRLAADLSATYGLLMQRAHRQFEWAAYLGFLWMDEFKERPGIYLMEPYQPDKIPILMVHGLLSSPLAWRELSNEVWGTPELRSRYQVWHYFYPTTYPYLFSATELRDRLTELRSFLQAPTDPRAPINNMVIISHSMGGLISRPLVTRSGTALWDTAFRVPPSQISATQEDLDFVTKQFFFEPVPWVNQIFFLASPFRGSQETQTWWARLGVKLADIPPANSAPFRRIAQENPGKLQAIMAAKSKLQKFVSISAMQPGNPVRNRLAAIKPTVPAHVILGDEDGVFTSAEDANDGFVPGFSARVPGAASEKIVHSGHSVFRCPEAMAEVKRWLSAPARK
jgi:pimeloyl-ACP methyl ester carboxylesterase